jgi:hypothetical protein
MPELEKTYSGKGWRRQRATSGPIRPTAPQLERLYSGQHLDDYSYYHHDDHHEFTDDDSSSIWAADTLDEEHISDGKPERGNEEADEIRDSSPGARDLESRTPQLEKRTTTRSVKPENLVGISHPVGTS